MAWASLSKRQKITEYSPGCSLGGDVDHGVRRVILQVFGMLGHGKSSLINSCLCVARGGGYENEAYSGANYGGITMTRTEYELTSKLVMIDNRGFNKLKPAEVLESSAQFRSLRGLGEVTWTGISLRQASRICDGEQRKEPVDLLVPVFVHSCEKNWNETDAKEIEKLFATVYSSTGIRPIIVITHSSVRKPEEFIENFRKFHSTHFFTLENYTWENHQPNSETDSKIVEFLCTCLEEAESRIKKMAEENPSERAVTEATKQIQEEKKRMQRILDQLSKALE